jgi:hypothetical protein
MVNGKLPAWLGVPEIWPLDAVSVKPGGNEPELTDHVYGAAPPLAVNVAEYGMLTWPLGTDVLVSCSGEGPAAEIVSVYCLLAVCAVVLESFTCTLNVNAPAWLGEPLNAPPELSVSPAGRDDPVATDQE